MRAEFIEFGIDLLRFWNTFPRTTPEAERSAARAFSDPELRKEAQRLGLKLPPTLTP